MTRISSGKTQRILKQRIKRIIINYQGIMELYAFLNRSVNKSFSKLLHGCNIGVGYANGYVAIPPGHPLHSKDYNKANEVIDIHGGLTFSGSMEEIKADGWRDETECIGFDNFDEIPKDYWVFGFDTMHFSDGPHLDRQWCINETNVLLKQLSKINNQ